MIVYGAIVALAIAVAAFYVNSKRVSLPGPGLWHLLPGGRIYALFADFRSNTDQFHSMGKCYGDVYQICLGPTNLVVTAVPQDIEQIMSTAEYFPRPPNVAKFAESVMPGSFLGNPSKDKHRSMRRKMMSDFVRRTPRAKFEGLHTDAVARLIERLSAKTQDAGLGEFSKPFDIAEELQMTTFRVISRIAFGVDVTDEEAGTFAKSTETFSDELMRGFVMFPFHQAFPFLASRKNLEECKRLVASISRKIINRRIELQSESAYACSSTYLDSLLETHENVDDVLPLVMEFAFLGSHTLHIALVWSLIESCSHPIVVENLEEELLKEKKQSPLEPLDASRLQEFQYLQNIWKETLRLHPVASGPVRYTTRDITLRGSKVKVLKGTSVLANMKLAQTNPRIWRSATSFDPDRWTRTAGDKIVPGSFTPYALGPKSCGGRHLAEFEGPLILAELHRHFKFELACKPGEVYNCSQCIDAPKRARGKDGTGSWVPFRIKSRFPACSA